MSTITAPITDVDILETVIAPDRADMDRIVARAVLNLRFSATQIARMQELAAKNNDGQLTENERAEMESYARVGNFVNLLKAKARCSLESTRDDE